ncbi:S46 family peptidase [Corallincola luteus]|uniref:Dipeptidyl-peptidase n=1 Tax=Corallincola luteus TaxID=1775177 RepID=A0ABY2AQE6_9GAMM|nr:S46 family peptidase [Corallincola luteus]TCI04588.1 S46 family peptidase [Corallincola luteus]
MTLSKRTFLGAAIVSMAAFSAIADEGMWQPHQLPRLADTLTKRGLEIAPEKLSSLTEFPMNAVISLGGCTASFVSPKGLVVTNHHCAYGSIQFNSTPDQNYLEDGFLAKQLDQELPAAPGSRVYVTESVTEVTDQVLASVTSKMNGEQRYQAIEAKRKTLVAECEQAAGYRCDVASFHHGLEYFLTKKLEIRDVRLVHAPAMSVGKYGGDIDNWMWPRHTGDYSFYRAYVGPDGQPADFSKDNVPYEPKSFLKVSAKGVEKGDLVMVAGYPGRTNRYRTADEVQNQFEWAYPNGRIMREALIDLIKVTAEEGSDARIKYESTLASLANYAKNFQSMVESYHHSDFLKRKQKLEKDLNAWIKADKSRQKQYGKAVSSLAELVDQSQSTQARDLVFYYMYYAQAPQMAKKLYRLANEKQKPDAEREPGYQDRDMTRFKASLARMDRRFAPEVDKALLMFLLQEYAKLPKEQRLPTIDNFFGITDKLDSKALSAHLDKLYASTKIGDAAMRQQWMETDLDALNKVDDPFIKFARSTYQERMMLEKADKALTGEFQQWRPQYMAALIAFAKSKGQPIYADANSTLRVSHGQVKGNSPQDGLVNLPFTRLEGIAGKDTGVEPFNAPAKQLQLITSKKYGDYLLPSLGSVPVNFLSTVDTTGGNSGSPTLNGRAELVGLLFDGVYESIIGDWDFNDDLNRSIHVDTRYMLWVMKYVDGADNLIEEMDIVE